MLKRYFLFFATNICIVVTISFLLNILGVQPYIQSYGLNMKSLAAFCLVWGMAGSFISLAISRIMAKMMMGVQVIDPQTRDSELQWLVSTVHNLARSANLGALPEVGIYESPELNAFATGPTRNRALVAVSSGLLQSMTHNEIEGVLGHEVTHISNGDMVTMTLLQGVMNAFVMFIARVIAFAASQNVKEENRYMVRVFVTMGLEIVLAIFSAMIVAAFSRYREYRADRGGALLAGRENMIAALRALKLRYEPIDNRGAAMNSLKIAGPGGIMRFMASHPPLEERILRLEQLH